MRQTMASAKDKTSITSPAPIEQQSAKPSLLDRVKKLAEPVLHPVDSIAKRMGVNLANEKQDAATQEMLKTIRAENWQLPSGGETYQMAMAAKRALHNIRRMRDGMPEKETQGQDKTGTNVLVDEKSTKTDQNKKEILEEKLEGLTNVMTATNELEQISIWKQYIEDHQLPKDQNFSEHVLDVVKDYRKLTGEKYQAPSQDIEQDPISKLEDYAKTSLENQKNLESMTKQEKADVEKSKITELQTETKVDQDVHSKIM